MRLLRVSEPIAMAFITEETPCPSESCSSERTRKTAIPAPRAGKKIAFQPKSNSVMKTRKVWTLQLSPTASIPQTSPIPSAAVIITTASRAETAWKRDRRLASVPANPRERYLLSCLRQSFLKLVNEIF